MNHAPRGKAISEGDLGVARLAAPEETAFLEQFGTRCAVDGAIDAAAAKKTVVGGIDDDVDRKPDDVGVYSL